MFYQVNRSARTYFRSARVGQAAVEFALGALVLLAVLYGILEIGRLILINAEVENAAREAAQYVAYHPNVTNTYLKTNVVEPKLFLTDKSSVQVTRLDANTCAFCTTRVEVRFTWVSLVNIVPDAQNWTLRPLGPIDLRSSAVKIIEAGN